MSGSTGLVEAGVEGSARERSTDEDPAGAGTVVLAGATGFIGSAVLRELCAPGAARRGAPGGGLRVRVVGRNRPAGLADDPRVEWVRGDLADPTTLRGVCDGAAALVNTTSYVGPDRARCDAVNRDGTAALMAEAAAAGVGRIVHVSTAAVYGPGPHRDIEVNEHMPRPSSAASSSRLAGEEPVLAAGGLVLRPWLVVGPGDRWAVPGLAELLRRVPARWDGGQARLSLVGVEDLARLIAAAVVVRTPVTGIHHAAHPQPVRAREVIEALAAQRVVPRPEGELAWRECVERLAASEGRMTEHHLGMFARDHHFRSDGIWRLLSVDPGPGPLTRLTEAAAWYRVYLAGLRG
ncbi:NAD-dependent epimerase/dehydratase family protein [Streptomyces sp. NPDC006879]|uniref:NAD-dependent epimerase/dehydratase family protein n=1 Tax=Streptomyces sp. NPDC006879 TaxID=3364767 RepID=UPI0036A04359